MWTIIAHLYTHMTMHYHADKGCLDIWNRYLPIILLKMKYMEQMCKDL